MAGHQIQIDKFANHLFRQKPDHLPPVSCYLFQCDIGLFHLPQIHQASYLQQTDIQLHRFPVINIILPSQPLFRHILYPDTFLYIGIDAQLDHHRLFTLRVLPHQTYIGCIIGNPPLERDAIEQSQRHAGKTHHDQELRQQRRRIFYHIKPQKSKVPSTY